MGWKTNGPWEYTTVILEPLKRTSTLNAMGEQGWELVSVVRSEASNRNHIAYFKRPGNGGSNLDSLQDSQLDG